MTYDRKHPEDWETLDGPTDRPPPLLNATRIDHPEEVREWLTVIREQVDHGFGAGEDATRPFRKRFFARAEARRRVLEAEETIRNLLAALERGLP